jgi:hypothetical protein
MRNFVCRFQGLPRRDEAIAETNRVSFVAGDPAAGEQQLQRSLVADRTPERDTEGKTVVKPKLNEVRGHRRRGRKDAEVGSKR